MLPESGQCTPQVPAGSTARRCTRQNDHIDRRQVSAVAPERLADQPLEAVPVHRSRRHPPGYREPESRVVRGPRPEKNRQIAVPNPPGIGEHRPVL